MAGCWEKQRRWSLTQDDKIPDPISSNACCSQSGSYRCFCNADVNQVKVLFQFIATFSVLTWEHIGRLNSHLKAPIFQVFPQVSGFKHSQTLLALTPSKWKDFCPQLPPSCCSWVWCGLFRILSGVSTEAEPALHIAVWSRIFCLFT